MQPQPQPDIKGEGGPSQPAVGPSPIATILQTSPSSIATTVPLALWFELAPLREAPFWRQPEVPARTTTPHNPSPPHTHTQLTTPRPLQVLQELGAYLLHPLTTLPRHAPCRCCKSSAPTC